jgi:hypothetical protein
VTEDAVIRECPKCGKWRKFASEQGKVQDLLPA